MRSSPRISTRSPPPEIEITAGEEDGDVEFDAVVEVRPVVNLTGYDSLQVELDFTPPDDETVQAQVDGLRERFADLAESSEPLTDTDYAEIDISGSVDGEPVDALTATDFLYEVGSETVTPGARRGAAGQAARRHRRVHRRAARSASVNARAKRWRSGCS